MMTQEETRSAAGKQYSEDGKHWWDEASYRWHPVAHDAAPAGHEYTPAAQEPAPAAQEAAPEPRVGEVSADGFWVFTGSVWDVLAQKVDWHRLPTLHDFITAATFDDYLHTIHILSDGSPECEHLKEYHANLKRHIDANWTILSAKELLQQTQDLTTLLGTWSNHLAQTDENAHKAVQHATMDQSHDHGMLNAMIVQQWGG
jgi:hypothetical protein